MTDNLQTSYTGDGRGIMATNGDSASWIETASPRDRIIDMLKRNGFGVDDENRAEMAGALIAELGLRQERHKRPIGSGFYYTHRYVTDWEADDE